MAVIVPIVEGYAEVESIPILFRKILARQNVHDVLIARPFRVHRSSIVRPDGLERAVTQAARSRDNVGAVFVVLDSDDDCPAQLGPTLLGRARGATDMPVAVVLAKKEMESWFLGAKESLQGIRGIRNDSMAPNDPEEIRGAKERLTQNMIPGRRYLPVDDQPALAHAMNLQEAQARCPSFAKLIRELNRLVDAIRENQP
ncbi:MAG: DUF4276 family protein [Acidobacteria bacterium]|nr:DUF4276 family protein [Acidobacteriota bacterium]